MLNRRDILPKDYSLHSTNLLNPAEDKYKIASVPKSAIKEKQHLMLPTCSNTYIFQLTKTWDKGSRVVRERILREFVATMSTSTGPQLERELNNGASLFLTRISAWLRLTYLLGHDLVLQLKALGVFVSAASGNRFLSEFLEVGGILTVLEILTIAQAKESDRAEAMLLLIKVAANGRKYKEFICESYGVRQVTECLSKSKSEVSQDHARNLLVSLGTGNPKFQLQVFKGLQTLVSSPAVAPTAQQMSAQALRLLMASADTFPPGLIDASASLLRSQHMQVQYEGYELLRELIQRPPCQEPIIGILVSILKMVFETTGEELERRGGAVKDSAKRNSITWTGGATSNTADEHREKERLLCGYIQQTYATKLIGTLIASSDELAEKLINHQLVSSLLNVIANVYHPESQKYATDNLLYLVSKFEYVASALRSNMGQNFFDLLENKPDTFYRELTKEQVRYLRRNNIKIRTANAVDGANSAGKDDDAIDSGSDSDENGSSRKSKHVTAFPGAYEPEADTSNSISGATGEKTADLLKGTQPAQGSGNQEKLQEQIILDSYEKSDSQGAPRRVVEDVYTQYQQSGVTTTFPGNKYVANRQNDRVQFDNELESFRNKNKRKNDQKKVFEPELLPETTARMQELRTDASIFSHEKMLNDIDRHLNMTGADQHLTPEDKNLIRIQHSSNQHQDLDKYGSQDDVTAPQAELLEETRPRPPLTADEVLDLEAEQAFSRGREAELIDDDWAIDINKSSEKIAEDLKDQEVTDPNEAERA